MELRFEICEMSNIKLNNITFKLNLNKYVNTSFELLKFCRFINDKFLIHKYMLFDIRHSNYSTETYVYKFLSNTIDIFKLGLFMCRH